MRTTSNGETGNGHVRRYRVDPRDKTLGAHAAESRHSGRLLIVCGVAGLLVLWGVLFLIFQDWRARYRELAKYGETQVAPTVEVLSDQIPPGVDPKAWRDAVTDTRSMLVVVTSAGQLDRLKMEALRDDLVKRFADVRPETALQELGRLWDEMEAKAGPVVTRKPTRPPYPPDRPKLLTRLKSKTADVQPR